MAKVHAYFHTNQARLGLKAQASLLRIIMASLGPQLVTFINIIKTEKLHISVWLRPDVFFQSAWTFLFDPLGLGGPQESGLS